MSVAEAIEEQIRARGYSAPIAAVTTKNNDISFASLEPVMYYFLVYLTTSTVLTAFFSLSLMYTSAGTKFAAKKRPGFMPKSNASVVWLIFATFALRAISSTLTVMREAPQEHLFFTLVWVANVLVIFALFGAYVFISDATAAVLFACMLVFLSFADCGIISEASATANNVALIIVGLSVYLLVGVGRNWFRDEMKQAMKDLEERGLTLPGGKQKRPEKRKVR